MRTPKYPIRGGRDPVAPFTLALEIWINLDWIWGIEKDGSTRYTFTWDPDRLCAIEAYIPPCTEYSSWTHLRTHWYIHTDEMR
jgi:hypothetical protein